MLRLVLGEGLRLALPGTLIGVAAALGAARFFSSALYGVSGSDPASFGLAAALQTLVAMTACLVPAWRATRADPIAALRVE